MPRASCFSSLEAASSFFEPGSLGYSVTRQPGRLDGIELRTEGWAVEPLEVWMIRRHQTMKFLGGYYAFPGGRVDAADGAAEALACCHGVDVAAAEAMFPGHDGGPALAFWVTAVRELLEESGILFACDMAGRAIDDRAHGGVGRGQSVRLLPLQPGWPTAAGRRHGTT